MPVYEFRSVKDDRLIEKYLSFAEYDAAQRNGDYFVFDGEEFRRVFSPQKQHHAGSTWPMISRALAVHPSQRRQYAKFAEEHDVPTEFDEMGHPVFRSKGHRKKYAELVGATDFDGGFGDPNSEGKDYESRKRS